MYREFRLFIEQYDQTFIVHDVQYSCVNLEMVIVVHIQPMIRVQFVFVLFFPRCQTRMPLTHTKLVGGIAFFFWCVCDFSTFSHFQFIASTVFQSTRMAPSLRFVNCCALHYFYIPARKRAIATDDLVRSRKKSTHSFKRT